MCWPAAMTSSAAPGLHCAPRILPALGFPAAGSVRLSLSRFTTEKEIGAVLSAFEEILSDG